MSFLNELKDKSKSVNDITTEISCLKANTKRHVYKSWLTMVKENFNNLDHLFSHLTDTVWSIIDHYLLEYLINELGSEELKKDMNIYTSQLKDFKRDTLVSDFICCWKDALLERDIPDFEKIVIKYEAAKTTLADLDKSREDLNRRLLPSLTECASSIYYGKFDTGCFVITLHAPREIVKEWSLMCTKETQLFDDFRIIYIIIDHNKVYDRNEDWTRGKFTIIYNLKLAINPFTCNGTMWRSGTLIIV